MEYEANLMLLLIVIGMTAGLIQELLGG